MHEQASTPMANQIAPNYSENINIIGGYTGCKYFSYFAFDRA